MRITIQPSVFFVVAKALVCSLVLMHTATQATGTELPKRPFVYKADSRRLADVLHDFAASMDVPVIVAEGVEGTVNGKFNLTPSSFLDLMSSAYGLTWYFDGNSLFVYPARSNVSKVLFLRDFGAERIERLLRSLKLGDRRFPLRYDPTEKTLVISGPPRHIELVQSLVDAIAEHGREQGRRIVRVFPLHYASASDQSIGGTTVTGMVTLLGQVYGSIAKPDKNGAAIAGGGPLPLPAMAAMYGADNQDSSALQAKANDRADKVLGSGASAFSVGGATVNDRGSAKSTTAVGPAPLDDDRPTFTSDDANNAVVVRGLPGRMAVYADLIRQLDVSADLIELEATIIDVRHDDASAFGVDWNLQQKSTQAGYASVPTLASASGIGSVFQLTTLSADLSRQLLLRVNALQQQGRARVIARPRVVGVANRLAIMKDTRSASVRVAGNLSTNLYSLETGTQIQVIPRKVRVEGLEAIKLALSIQDGSFDSNTVDAIPIVKRTEISTEAYVGEGEGLLIGGISSESDSNQQSGLPGLSRIPVLGALFRSAEDQASRRERLFLITPRVISLARKVTSRINTAAEGRVAFQPSKGSDNFNTAIGFDVAGTSRRSTGKK